MNVKTLFSYLFVLGMALASVFNCGANDIIDYTKYKVSENAGMYSLADIFNSPDKLELRWNGCEPSKYKEMKFYDEEGKTLVRGIIKGYVPDNHGITFGIRTKTLLNELNENMGTINPDATFELEVDITHPHLCTLSFGEIYKDVYLSPGDTIDIVTTVNRSPIYNYWPEYVGFRGEFDDVVAINLLNDSIKKHYNLSFLWQNYNIRNGEEMKGDTYKANESLANLLDSIMTDLPDFIGYLPVSDKVKDMVEVLTAANISQTSDYLATNFSLAHPNSFSKDEDGNLVFALGDQLDMKVKFAPWLKHKELLYDNPLMLCSEFSVLSGWVSNDLFNQGLNIACRLLNPADSMTYYQDGVSVYDRLKQVDGENLHNIGVGNCFAAQYARCKGLCKEIGVRAIPDSLHLKTNGELVRNLLRLIDYEPLSKELMSTFEDYMKDVLIAENKMIKNDNRSKLIDDSANIGTLEKLIADYKGNVLFLDFWSIGCGPCLNGMKQQKSLIKEYEDRPFKALYIAADDVTKMACERWLDKNEIKGEHIFVSPDDWRRLSSIFNFSSIPFGVLIDKNGDVIAKDYDIMNNTRLLDDTLSAE